MHKKIKHFIFGVSIIFTSLFTLNVANAAVVSWTNAIPWEFCDGGSWTTSEGVTSCGFGGTYRLGTLYPSRAVVDIKNDSDVSVDTFAPGERITLEGYAENLSSGSFAVDVSAAGILLCSATDNCWGSASTYAPMTPGAHSITVRTCWSGLAGCSNSSVAYTVSAPVAPAAPTVNIEFQ